MMFPNQPFLLTIFIILSFAFLLQLFYYLFYYLAPVIYKDKEGKNSEPVSIIICARNEEENLKKFLPAILEQDYPDFEVIVVNDCSEDDSYKVLGDYLGKYSNLRVSNISKDPKFTHNKKFAQFIGIKAAKNEFLLFTDADCAPTGNKWIENMASNFNDKTDFVLGYGGYFKDKGLLNRYIRYDSMTIAMQYLGMALKGRPYMGVGRNLAYRRSLFFDKKGFGSHTHLASGDDDLFVNSNASGKNCVVEFRKESHTRSVPSATFRSFYKQKKRHLTTADLYKTGDKVILTAEPVSRVVFYSSFIILISRLYLWPVVLAVFIIRLGIQAVVFLMNQRRLDEQGLFIFMPIFDIFSPFINTLFYIGSIRHRSGKNIWS